MEALYCIGYMPALGTLFFFPVEFVCWMLINHGDMEVTFFKKCKNFQPEIFGASDYENTKQQHQIICLGVEFFLERCFPLGRD